MPTLETPHRPCRARFRERARAPEVLITRARRDCRSPTVASRFLLRLDAISGGLPRDLRLERLARALDDPGPPHRSDRPAPAPPAEQRPDSDLGHRGRSAQGRSVRLLRAGDPQASRRSTRSMPITRRALEGQRGPRDARGVAAAGRLRSRQAARRAPRRLLQRRGDPSDAARSCGRRGCWKRSTGSPRWSAKPRGGPPAARREISGRDRHLPGSPFTARADRIDRLADGGLAIIDYKTGQPPRRKRSTKALRCSSACSA